MHIVHINFIQQNLGQQLIIYFF